MPARRNFVCGMLAAPLPDLPALIIDGRHNHNWRATTAELRSILAAAGFPVDVATAPPANEGLAAFRPGLSRYRVVTPDYTGFGNGGEWPEPFGREFERCVSGGGGVVIVHAASSALPNWREYNEITGLGGWGGRDRRCGPFLYFKDGAMVRGTAPGRAGHPCKQHACTVTSRAPGYPIMAGLPASWPQATDELFDSLRGPARNLEVLATAWSGPASGGAGRHEPALFTVRFGKGRIFHTLLGHSPASMRSSGFVATVQRGAEWVATGRVTRPGPAGLDEMK